MVTIPGQNQNDGFLGFSLHRPGRSDVGAPLVRQRVRVSPRAHPRITPDGGERRRLKLTRQNDKGNVQRRRPKCCSPPCLSKGKMCDFLKNGEGGEYFRPVFVRECDLKTDEIRDRKTEFESQRENQAQHWWQPLVLCGSALQ